MRNDTCSLGDRLVEVGQPRQEIRERYRMEVERIMGKEIRKFKQTRLIYWIMGPIMVIQLLIFARMMESAETVQRQLNFAFWGIWAFLFFLMLLGGYLLARYTLEVRKDLKELTLAVEELKESVDRR